MELENKVKHVIQSLLTQLVDMNNHVASIQANETMEESDKVANTNFGHWHTMVLSVFVHELKDEAYSWFPEAKKIVDWAESHYNLNLEKGNIKPCKCPECPINAQVV